MPINALCDPNSGSSIRFHWNKVDNLEKDLSAVPTSPKKGMGITVKSADQGKEKQSKKERRRSNQLKKRQG